MDAKATFDPIAIVLQRPKYAGNVGSVARAMKNMGLSRLLVSEAPPFQDEAMKMMSTHAAADIIDGMRCFPDIGTALADFQYIVGTTARLGSARGPAVSPRDMAPRIVEIARNNEVALLFGSEDKGLSNDDLRYCHAVVTIPVSEDMRSINLSHAVMIVCYEVFTAAMAPREVFTPKLASSREIEGMYAQMKDVLMEVGFLNPQNPDYFMTHIRRLLSRTGLLARDVKILRGICRQVSWAVKNAPPGDGGETS